MIKVFYTPAGSGNATENLFKEALKHYNTVHPDYSGILYLTTTPAKLREAQRIFHGLAAKYCYTPPEMVTINQLSKRLYSLYGDRRMFERSLSPVIIAVLSGKGLGFSTLVADLIGEVKAYYPDKRPAEVREIFSSIFEELNIPESVAGFVLECLDIFDRYQRFVEEKGIIDEDDVVRESLNLVSPGRGMGLLKGYSLLILDGFFDLTVSEMNLLKALIQGTEDVLISVPYRPVFSGLLERYINFLRAEFHVEEVYLSENNDPSVTNCAPLPSAFIYHPFPDPESEVEGIARHIKYLYISGGVRELERVVVAFPELNKYASMIERVFMRYGIPYSISRSVPIGKMKPFLDLFCLLTSVEEDYTRLKFSRFLSSGYFSRMPDSLKRWVPMLSLRSGIISGKGSWLRLVSDGSEAVDIKAINKEGCNIERDLRWVFEKIRPLEELKRPATLNICADRLKTVLEDLGFPDTSSGVITDDMENALREVLDYISFLGDIHPAEVTLSEFVEVLRHLLNSSFIDEERPGVRVMDFREVMGLHPEYLYLGGLTDGAVPGRQDMDHILPDSVRKRLGFLHLDRHIEIQRFIFDCIVRSSRGRHLSYPETDGEDMFLPSSFLYPGEAVREEIPGVFSKEEYIVGQGRGTFSRYIAEIEIDPSISPYSGGGIIRVTDIDAFRACPRRFFIEKVLGLTPPSVKEYEIEAITIGNIAHRVMEKIILEPFKSLDYLLGRADEVLDEVIRDSRIDGYWKDLIRDTFMEVLPEIYERELEIRSGDYISTEVERPISGEPVKGIRLRGKIDRFDRIGDSIQIIDYKTGGAGLTCSQVMKGNENLQLFLYAAMMKCHGYRVDRVGIYSLKDIRIKWCPPRMSGRGKGKNREDIDDYITASLGFLEDAVKGMRSGDFTARPLNDYNCRNCHENPFCPYMQQRALDKRWTDD